MPAARARSRVEEGWTGWIVDPFLASVITLQQQCTYRARAGGRIITSWRGGDAVNSASSPGCEIHGDPDKGLELLRPVVWH